MVNSKLVEGNATPERRSSGEEGGDVKSKRRLLRVEPGVQL